MFAPPAVQGSAAPEMQTVPGPTAAAQSSSVVQIGPPHSPSRQSARKAQSLFDVHGRPMSPLQRPGRTSPHRAPKTQSASLPQVWWDRPGAAEQAQQPPVVGIAQQFGLPPQVTMFEPQSVLGVGQTDAP